MPKEWNPNWKQVPEHIRSGIKLYLTKGVMPGHFLQAVICNQLKESFMYADDENIYHMWDIVNFFYNEVPLLAWGSRKNMIQWHESGGAYGFNNPRSKDPSC